MTKAHFVLGSRNVYKDVGFDDTEAKGLQFRSHLMTILIRYIQKEKLTQQEAAQRLKVTQPRISNLMQGKIDLFSADMLLNMLERAGFRIYKKIEIDLDLIFKKYQAQREG